MFRIFLANDISYGELGVLLPLDKQLLCITNLQLCSESKFNALYYILHIHSHNQSTTQVVDKFCCTR